MRALTVTACACLLALAGCTGAEEIPQPSTPPVPSISNALDAGARSPCDLLTGEHLQAHELDSGQQRRDDIGPQCVWHGANSKTLALTLYLDGGGLGALAGQSDPAASRVRVLGYPALETFTERGQYCRYDVGVAPDQALIATMTGGEPDSCTALQSLLKPALGALPHRR